MSAKQVTSYNKLYWKYFSYKIWQSVYRARASWFVTQEALFSAPVDIFQLSTVLIPQANQSTNKSVSNLYYLTPTVTLHIQYRQQTIGTHSPLSLLLFSSMVICSASSESDSSIVWLPRRVSDKRLLNLFILSIGLWGRGGLREHTHTQSVLIIIGLRISAGHAAYKDFFPLKIIISLKRRICIS